MGYSITVEELQGAYDIRYQSTPILPDWYEPGIGDAKIEGTHLKGADGVGVIWNADLKVLENGIIEFEALLDPKDAPPNAGLMDKNGKMTKEKQSYSGKMNVTKSNNKLILRTRVQQGPLTIDVQFIKRP